MNNHKPVGDELWPFRKVQTNRVADTYQKLGFTEIAEKMRRCATQMDWAYGLPNLDRPVRDIPQRLQWANFCRVPTCPTCIGRKGAKWRAKMMQAMPSVLLRYPEHRWLFLTLTVENCPLVNLRSTTRRMKKAIARWAERGKGKTWPFVGWIKSLEVTRAENDYSHPHFHILGIVPPSYFRGRYLENIDYVILWKHYFKCDYFPGAWIQAVDSPTQNPKDLKKAVVEVAKYCVKPADLLKGKRDDGQWLYEFGCQMYGDRFIESHGIFRSIFKEVGDERVAYIEKDDDKMFETPMRSIWLYHQGDEDTPQGYQTQYFWNQQPISDDQARDTFEGWCTDF